MIGGYMNFVGKCGQVRYGLTPVADVLPIKTGPAGDRIETPEGAVPWNEGILGGDFHDKELPVLGYNRTTAKPSVEI